MAETAGWRRGSRAALVTLVALGLALAAPAAGQKAARDARRGDESDRQGASIQVVVDSGASRTWTPRELVAMATETWEGAGGAPHPAISLWRLVEESGVSREDVKELRVSGARTVTLTGEALPRTDQLLLRTGRQAGKRGRSWQLVARTSPSEPKRRPLLGQVSQVEVITGRGSQ